MISVTAIVCVKNEAVNLPHSLPPLHQYFDEVLVVDSHSDDGTHQYATHQFTWNGHYPKKRQWVLDHIPTKHDWVFMVDADEIVTDDFVTELQNCDFSADGYFISSRIFWRGKFLKFGMKNNKLCLLNKVKFEFPAVDDLGVSGMGEIEGHYQPIKRSSSCGLTTGSHNINDKDPACLSRNDKTMIGQIRSPLIHHDRKGNWHGRHDHYVTWEAEMNRRKAWPKDPVKWREFMKSALRASYLRPIMMFMYSYIVKGGFLDGRAGFDYAVNRARYTWRIVRATRQTNGRP